MGTMMKTTAAAERLGVRPSTLRYWRMLRHGPPYHELSPRCVVYDENDLIEWLADRRRVPSVRASLKR
jgi:DNA-binding transcriptional MerR regulator